MFFESNDVIAVYRTVFSLNQTDVITRVKPRSDYAISFRYHAENAVLKQNDREFRVKTGDIAFVPTIGYSRSADKDSLTAIHFGVLNATFSEIETFTPSDPSVFEKLFRKAESSPSDKYLCQSILYEILSLIHREKGSFSHGAPKKILPATERLRRGEALGEITVASLAADCGLSEPTFRKAFEETTGRSPSSVITEMKVNRAVEMIRSGDFKLDEVAEKVGYCDSKYLSCVIKRITGISPRGWSK